MTSRTASHCETTRLTITWSKERDIALRTFLGAQGMKKGDISKFVEEAVRRHIFRRTLRNIRTAFAHVPPDKLQTTIDEAVEEVRAEHYRARAKRY
jgi:arsenate reductase-like glutaredoxin family protein